MSNYDWLPKADQFPKKSALTPIGAAAFGIFACSIVGTIVLQDSPLAWVILTIGALPVMSTVWGFWHFAKTDPDRLQTEDFRIQREIVAKVTGMEGFGERHVPPPDAPPIARIEDFTDD